MKIMSYFELKFGGRTILCSARALPTSLRAEGVAISVEIPSPSTGEGQGEGEIPPPSNSLPPGEGVSAGIAEPVPNEMRNLLLRVCFGSASQPLSLLAMTEGGSYCITKSLIV